MEIGKVIAHNLKKLREERNLSQGQLAELAGVSKVVVSQIEKGDSDPTINTIWKLTGALELPYTSLLEMERVKPVHIRKEDISELVEDKYHIFSYYPKTRKEISRSIRWKWRAGANILRADIPPTVMNI